MIAPAVEASPPTPSRATAAGLSRAASCGRTATPAQPSAIPSRAASHYAEAAFLEDATRPDVAGCYAGVERPRPVDGQERLEGIGRNPFAPVGTTDPGPHLALAGVAPGPDRPGDVVVDDDDPGEHRLVGS
jgi:hypothetical protein